MCFKIFNLEIISCFSKFKSCRLILSFQILKANSKIPLQVSYSFKYFKKGKIIKNKSANGNMGIEGEILRDLIYFSVKLRKCI